MEDPIQQTTSEEPKDVQTSWIAYHNDTIIGIFGSELDAKDATNGYELENDIEIGEQIEIRQIL